MTDWSRAACRGLTHLFYGHDHEGPKQRNLRLARARLLCADCPCRPDCSVAAETEDVGVWAGVDLERTPRNRPPRHGPKPRPINHGTNGGYTTHRRRGEQPCDRCRDAHARYAHSTGAQQRWHAKQWTLTFITRLRAAALVESMRLRRELRRAEDAA
jgi:Transcription factor WhiB